MEIFIRAGHNYLSTGAYGELIEHKEVRQILPHVVTYLKNEGHNVHEEYSNNVDQNTDLRVPVELANNGNYDLFVSLHLNSSNPMGNGTECWVYPNSSAKGKAENICANLGKYFKNRGVKTSSNLYELRATKMPSIIVEICFVSGTDVLIFKNLGYKEIARNIASGILGYNITDNSENECSCCYCKSKK